MTYNKEQCSTCFSGIVEKLYENKWISYNDVDTSKKEFQVFLESNQHEYKDDFLLMYANTQRIDHFIGS